MKTLLTPILLIVITLSTYGQQNYEKLAIEEGTMLINAGIALCPGKNLVAVSTTQGHPIILYNWENQQKLNEFKVGDYFAGPKIRYSKTGKYLLLQKQFYVDWRPNKDREVEYEILDATNGNSLVKIGSSHSVKIDRNETFALSLEGDDIIKYDLPSGEKTKLFTVADAKAGMEISADGEHVFVAHSPEIEDLKGIPSIRPDAKKKELKPILKYRQVISKYEISTGKKLSTIKETYDMIFTLTMSIEGNKLFIYNRPNQKMATSANLNQGYINQVDLNTLEPLREAFISHIADPDFSESPDGSLFGVVTEGPELLIYDNKNATLLARFSLKSRIFEKSEGGFEKGDGRMYFTFLPDNASVLLTYGNRLVHWKL